MSHLAYALRTGVRQTRRLVVKNWPLLALLALSAAALSPGINTGYWAEDVYHSVVFGGAPLVRNSTWWSETIMSLKISLLVGRFFPITPFFTAIAFFLFQSATAYKAYILAVTLLDLVVFTMLVKRLTGRRDFALFAGITSASLFQFRLGVDPILAYYAQIQWVTAAYLMSLLFLRRYFDEGGRVRWLYASALCYWFCTLSYETTYSFVVIQLGLIAAARPGWQRGARIAQPYLMAVLFCGFMTWFVRWLHPSTNYVHNMDFRISRVLLSIVHQVSAGLPLSYYLADPRHVFGSGRGLVAWLDWLMEPTVIAIFAGAVALNFRTLQKGRRTGTEPMGPVDTPTLILLGLALAIVPAGMISISPHHWHYQDYGTGWIQVMVQYFGVGLLMALGLWKLVASARGGSFARWKCLAVASLLAAILSITYRANREVAITFNAPPGTKRNQEFITIHASSCHMQRLHLIAAIEAGVMDDVPDSSRVILAHQYPLWHDSTHGQFFYTKHTGKRIKTYPSEMSTLLLPNAPLFVVRDEVKDWKTGMVVVTPACFSPFPNVPAPIGRFDKGRVFLRHPAIRGGEATLPNFLLVGHAPLPPDVKPGTPMPDDQALRLGTDLPVLRSGPGWAVLALGKTEREVEPFSLHLVTDQVEVASWLQADPRGTRFAGPGPNAEIRKR